METEKGFDPFRADLPFVDNPPQDSNDNPYTSHEDPQSGSGQVKSLISQFEKKRSSSLNEKTLSNYKLQRSNTSSRSDTKPASENLVQNKPQTNSTNSSIAKPASENSVHKPQTNSTNSSIAKPASENLVRNKPQTSSTNSSSTKPASENLVQNKPQTSSINSSIAQPTSENLVQNKPHTDSSNIITPLKPGDSENSDRNKHQASITVSDSPAKPTSENLVQSRSQRSYTDSSSGVKPSSGSSVQNRPQRSNTSAGKMTDTTPAYTSRKNAFKTKEPPPTPKQLLLPTLSKGMEVIKHGRLGNPKFRTLLCDDELKYLIIQAPNHYKKILIDEIESIRLGKEIDPITSPEALAKQLINTVSGNQHLSSSSSDSMTTSESKEDTRRRTSSSSSLSSSMSSLFGLGAKEEERKDEILYGTATLRRTCRPEDLRLCFSLIMKDRSVDFQCMNEADMKFLSDHLKEIIKK